jgi:thiol-disulfide isomerase/thioredoxin
MKFLLVFALLLPAVLVSAQDGIQFREGDWAALLAEAKATDRIIFLDAYASWCRPCQMMAANTFTDKATGDFYNANFIPAKIDMEKGEGPDLAAQYAVTAYPTLLFINGDGELVHGTQGYQEPAELIELGRIALDDNTNLIGMQKRFQNGDRDPAFLQPYAYALMTAGDGRAQEVAEAYLATQADWGTEENMVFVFNFANSTDSEMFRYLTANREKFSEAFGQAAIISHIQGLVLQELYTGGNTEPGLEELEKLMRDAYPDLAPLLIANLRMKYYAQAGDLDNYITATVDYVENHGLTDADELNDAAWNFAENVTDKALLEKALTWAKRSVEIDENYFNTDTVATIYLKLGKKKEAKKAAKRAIELAERDSVDASHTIELLEEIEKI